jgi:hypothetical protein
MSRAFEEALALVEDSGANEILLDTNLLVVYIVAMVDKSRVGKVKRTESFQLEDADFILWLLPRYARRVVTPGILAEASNLLEPFFRSLPREVLRRLQAFIRQELEVMEEHFVPARSFAHDEELLVYGFSDLAIAHLQRDRTVIFTNDLPLALLLQRRGLRCVNYNTIRLAIL